MYLMQVSKIPPSPATHLIVWPLVAFKYVLEISLKCAYVTSLSVAARKVVPSQ